MTPNLEKIRVIQLNSWSDDVDNTDHDADGEHLLRTELILFFDNLENLENVKSFEHIYQSCFSNVKNLN